MCFPSNTREEQLEQTAAAERQKVSAASRWNLKAEGLEQTPAVSLSLTCMLIQ